MPRPEPSVEGAVRELPRHSMAVIWTLLTLMRPGAAFGIDAAQPQVMFARAIHLAFESCCEIFDSTSHELRRIGKVYQKSVSG